MYPSQGVDAFQHGENRSLASRGALVFPYSGTPQTYEGLEHECKRAAGRGIDLSGHCVFAPGSHTAWVRLGGFRRHDRGAGLDDASVTAPLPGKGGAVCSPIYTRSFRPSILRLLRILDSSASSQLSILPRPLG